VSCLLGSVLGGDHILATRDQLGHALWHTYPLLLDPTTLVRYYFK
jgi:hypothetical protein